MPFREVFGQDYAISLIKNALNRSRMPQSWLFTGQANIGKYKTAVALSQKLNCEKIGDDACGLCDYCVQIEEKNFMDFLVVEPDGKNIKIGQIKKSLDWLNLSPDRANTRVMIIDDAKNLGREAANSFLKTLEEPSPNTLLILIAETSKQVPETIVSRCQQIRFKPLSEKITKKILNQNTLLSEDRIDLICSLGMGSIKKDLVSRIEIVENIHEIIIFWMTNLNSINLKEVLEKSENWGKSKDDEWIILLNLLEVWFRDLSFFLNGISDEKLVKNFNNISKSRILLLGKSANFFKKSCIQEIFWKIIETRKYIGLNANKSLALSSLFIYIFRRAL